MQNPLLIQAIPHEDESPMSFLLRTAELNAHSSIFNLIGKEKYKSIIRQSLNYHISDMKRFTQVLEVLNLDSSYKFLAFERLMCAEKNGDFNLVNYTYSSGVYHEQKTKDLYSRIQS
ncbi:hypothetical protein [Acinetobacter equi]|uniref:Uncharacterized protein n=1 Tax=Acinetobacter equi TaxID=1324350 RepID=A0A0N9VY52_9GAMM|nr:hypothetical protein [Acinetobacter equi]ALH94240.1 hypothetical protein AOY20_01045 [Acinetobacter equi]